MVTVSAAVNIMQKTAGKKIDEKIFKVFCNHIEYSNIAQAKDLRMSDEFDPSIPYAVLPLEEVEEMFTDDDFGKIRIIDEKTNKKTEEK